MDEEQNSCTICFESEAQSWISCQMCNTFLCHDCMNEYSNHTSLEVNKLPVCPQCKNEFLIESMDSREDVVLYSNRLFTYLTRNPMFMTKVNDSRSIKMMIDRIREEKLEIIAKMPKCIALCIRVALKSKLQEAMKDNKEHIKNIQQKRKCFSGVCPNGKLSEDMNGNLICDFCGNTFCKQCEKIMFQNHTCDPDDLESRAFIAGLVSCPTCYVPVQKIDGCDSLTCPLCKTNFENSTGNVGGHGGVYGGGKIDLKEDNSYRLCNELKDKYDDAIIRRIKAYEDKIPEEIDYSVLEPFFDNEELDEDGKINLFGNYSQVKTALNKRKQYFDIILAIRQLHIDDKLTNENLNRLLPRTTTFRGTNTKL